MSDKDTYYGIVTLEGVSEDDARWILTAMESMVEDSGSLESKGVEQPEHWSVNISRSGKPLDRGDVRNTIKSLNRRGSRPTPNGFAKRLGIEMDDE